MDSDAVVPADPIRRAFMRLFAAGYVANRAQRSPLGLAEYRRALADLGDSLLEEAVSRWIDTATERWFPTPAQLRSKVADELADRSRARFNDIRRAALARLRSIGCQVLAAD